MKEKNVGNEPLCLLALERYFKIFVGGDVFAGRLGLPGDLGFLGVVFVYFVNIFSHFYSFF